MSSRRRSQLKQEVNSKMSCYDVLYRFYEADPTIIFEVNYKAYEGTMSDLRVRTGRLQLLVTLSFPARPQYSKATFEASQLKKWYQDKDPNNRTPSSPFIPLCSS
ncbi:MAG: hypothetical protein F6K40_08980 [Okeania sp. SIO3I5]|uniref:hypothetical protein n=1 Tax=Okeania sp. SIO3I5 TaxID=2607805 RepID=UPI0013B93F52|nr:hypothetical protein [Okeania sp. SIO3I5]NEQ36397.1 hypothetical protein [Okeania sp. SIO3I5]